MFGPFVVSHSLDLLIPFFYNPRWKFLDEFFSNCVISDFDPVFVSLIAVRQIDVAVTQ